MKQLAILFFITFSLFSCKEHKEEAQAVLSESNGKINNVSMYSTQIKKIHNKGIKIFGSFIIGFAQRT